jgi:hypothetical protein
VSEASDLTGEAQRNDWFWPVFGGTISYSATEIIDTTKGLRIECPRIASVCLDMVCPSNCLERGVCDEDRDGKHSCICDDPFNDTPGCWVITM